MWTFNRSPHGNKTAREQFGRQVWQMRMERKGKGGEELRKRKERLKSQSESVSRKERKSEWWGG